MSVWLFWPISHEDLLCGKVSNSLQNRTGWKYIVKFLFHRKKIGFFFLERALFDLKFDSRKIGCLM